MGVELVETRPQVFPEPVKVAEENNAKKSNDGGFDRLSHRRQFWACRSDCKKK